MLRILPRRYNLFDEMLNDAFFDSTPTNHNLMKTDIKELDGNFLLDIELPGFKKEDIKIDLEQGTLKISASRTTSKEEKDDNGTIIRQERFSGQCSRSYYVGEGVTVEDIKAKFENGELKIIVPNKSKQLIEKATTIEIE